MHVRSFCKLRKPEMRLDAGTYGKQNLEDCCLTESYLLLAVHAMWMANAPISKPERLGFPIVLTNCNEASAPVEHFAHEARHRC